jgi:hypothetical protein
MRGTRLVAGGVVAGLTLGALAAIGVGGEGSDPEPLPVRSVATHTVDAPPAGRVATKAASLFKVIYKESDPVPIADGVTPFDLGACPRAGAVLSAWHIRVGATKAGLLATGSTPTTGSRRMDYVVTNTTGGTVDGRLGLICIK